MADDNPIPVELEELLNLSPLPSAPPGRIDPTCPPVPPEPGIEKDLPAIDSEDDTVDPIRLIESPALFVAPLPKPTLVIPLSPTPISNLPLPRTTSQVTMLPQMQSVIINKGIETKRAATAPVKAPTGTVLPATSGSVVSAPIAAPLSVSGVSISQTVRPPVSGPTTGSVTWPPRQPPQPLPEKSRVAELPSGDTADVFRTDPIVPLQVSP